MGGVLLESRTAPLVVTGPRDGCPLRSEAYLKGECTLTAGQGRQNVARLSPSTRLLFQPRGSPTLEATLIDPHGDNGGPRYGTPLVATGARLGGEPPSARSMATRGHRACGASPEGFSWGTAGQLIGVAGNLVLTPLHHPRARSRAVRDIRAGSDLTGMLTTFDGGVMGAARVISLSTPGRTIGVDDQAAGHLLCSPDRFRARHQRCRLVPVARGRGVPQHVGHLAATGDFLVPDLGHPRHDLCSSTRCSRWSSRAPTLCMEHGVGLAIYAAYSHRVRHRHRNWAVGFGAWRSSSLANRCWLRHSSSRWPCGTSTGEGWAYALDQIAVDLELLGQDAGRWHRELVMTEVDSLVIGGSAFGRRPRHLLAGGKFRQPAVVRGLQWSRAGGRAPRPRLRARRRRRHIP